MNQGAKVQRIWAAYERQREWAPWLQKSAHAGETDEPTPSGTELFLYVFTPTLTLTLLPDATALAISPETPTLLNGLDLTPGEGTLAITAGQPALTETLGAPTAAALVITGGQPSVSTADKILNPAAGSLAITPETPSLTVTLPPADALLLLAAGIPTVTHGCASPAAATLAIAPGTPTLTGGSSTILPAALTFTAGTPTLTVEIPAPAAAVLQLIPSPCGPGPTLRWTFAIDPGSPLVITGETPTLSIVRTVEPLAALLRIFGGQPSVDPIPGCLAKAVVSDSAVAKLVVTDERSC